MSQSLIVDISFEDEASEDIIVALKDIGGENVQQVRQRGFTGIETVIAAVLVVTALTDLVIRLSRLWKCGIIVDARGSRILTKKRLRPSARFSAHHCSGRHRNQVK